MGPHPETSSPATTPAGEEPAPDVCDYCGDPFHAGRVITSNGVFGSQACARAAAIDYCDPEAPRA